MNTILSIDLDILFSPYIGIYNSFIFENKPYEFLWERLKTQYNINDFKINEEYIKYIKNIIVKYKDKVNKIYIGADHSNILDAIQSEKDNLSKPYKFDIYNIDYHHDMGYKDEQSFMLTEEKFCDCGSWVSYLNYNNYINSYYWINGEGSYYNKILLEESEFKKFVPNKFFKYYFNKYYDNLLNLDIDLLYISISNPWIPPQYCSFIKEFISSLLDNKKIIYNSNPFFINGNRKKFLFNQEDNLYEISFN